MSNFITRLSNLSNADLSSILADYEHGNSILRTCDNKQEIIECLALAFNDELIDEIELIIIESGN